MCCDKAANRTPEKVARVLPGDREEGSGLGLRNRSTASTVDTSSLEGFGGVRIPNEQRTTACSRRRQAGSRQ